MRAFVTGTRRGDLLLFALLLALVLGFAGRLRVYHEVPAWALERHEAPAERAGSGR